MFKKALWLGVPICLGLFVFSQNVGATDLSKVLLGIHLPYTVELGKKLSTKSPSIPLLQRGKSESPSNPPFEKGDKGGFEIEGNHIKDEIIVKFKPDTGVASMKAKSTIASFAGASVKRVDKSAKFTVVKLKNKNVHEAVDYYNSLPNVEYAEPNYIYKAQWSPNDTNYSLQWDLSAISLSQAWDYDTTNPLHGGDPSIVVAVLDTGIAYESYDVYSKAPDFTGSYPAFVSPFDFISNDTHANDDQGHGTHVASTIAESTDNSTGMAGVAFNSTIMPVKVLGADGTGSADAIASGITWAKDHGAHILSMSIGSTSYSQTIADSVAGAVAAGKVLIAAAGNGGADSVGDPECDYPGRYDGVICVGSTRYNNNGRSTFSNYGTGLDIVAPGGQTDEGYFNGFYGWGIGTYATLNDCVNAIWTNYGIIDPNLCVGSDGIFQQSLAKFFEPDYFASTNYSALTYWGINGTSQATPHVSGVAALLMAYGVPAASIESILTGSATDLGATGYDTEYANGLLNAANAFTYPYISALSTSSASNDSATNITITGNNFSNSSPSGTIGSTALANVAYVNTTSMTATVPAHLAAGTYNITITSGGKTATLTNGFTITDTAPSAPTNFRTVSMNGKIKLAWSKPSDWDLAGVKIMRKTSGFPTSATDGTKVYQGTKTSKINKNLKNGKMYYYSAFAYDNAGNYSSASEVAASPSEQLIVTAPDRNRVNSVKTYNSRGTRQSATFQPFGASYRGGINLAVGDLDANGQEEFIFSTKEGQTPHIKIYDAKGREKFKKGGFYPFGKSYKCGANIAAGDLNGDGKDEIVAGLGQGCPAKVKIFNKNGKAILKKAGFKPYSGNVGAKVAVGNLNGDNLDEIVTAPSTNASAKIYIYGYSGGKIQKVLNTKGFLAFSKSMKSGVELAVGDTKFNKNAKIIVVPKSGNTSQIRVFNYTGKKVYKSLGFYPFGAGYKGGVNLAVSDVNTDGYAEIVVAKKSGSAASIYSYKGRKTTPKKLREIRIDIGSILAIGAIK